MPNIGIHVFRKDLRTEDNIALNELSKKVDRIVGVFIYDTKQIKKSQSNNFHYSFHAAQFIIDSVNDLNRQSDNKLIVAYGNPSSVLENLIKQINPIALSFNADFTPFSIKRDEAIKKICEKYNVEVIINDDDQTLAPMKDLVKKDGMPYMVFGIFYKKLCQQKILKPQSSHVSWIKPRVEYDTLNWKPIESNIIGGRAEALKKLKTRPNANQPDYLTTESSKLSAYLNQGCVSIREVYHSFNRGGSEESIRSIAWRDFFLCIYRFCPNGNSYDKFIDERYNLIKWTKVKESEWKRFINCDTGFLLIDAIMAELLQTGYINNRARLLLSTFWIKYLLISPFDPEYGSQTGFSKLLVDCSSSQNKLNHQWIIGDLDLSGRRFKMKGTHPLTGRMIRVDNDMIKKFDPQYEYISKWLPQYSGKSLKDCKSMMKQTVAMYEWRDRYAQYSTLFNSIEN